MNRAYLEVSRRLREGEITFDQAEDLRGEIGDQERDIATDRKMEQEEKKNEPQDQ